jgi:DNA-binding transcriptional ArsR family regulator
MYKELDPILHAQLRLQIVSLLMTVEEASFNFLLEATGATRGNLSIQIGKLKDAGYIEVSKQFKDNYPLTTCEITSAGRKAFSAYVEALQTYLKPGGSEG